MLVIMRLLPVVGLLCAGCGEATEPAHTQAGRFRPKTGSGCKQTVVNDRVSNNLVDVRGMSRFGLRHIAPRGYALRYTTERNQHDPTVVDTLYTLRAGTSELAFCNYTPSNPSRTVPIWVEATVRDRSLVVYPGVQVGMAKAAFLRLIGAKPTRCDTVEVVPSEQNASHYFFFAHDTLAAMWLHSGVE
jgi:hypothetical protein